MANSSVPLPVNVRKPSRLRRILTGSALFGEGRLVNLAWALFRVHIGLSVAVGAGWAKVVHTATAANSPPAGFWGNVELGVDTWFVDQVAGLGFTIPSPRFWAWMAAWGELVGGLGIAFGLLTRWNGLQLAFQFFVVSFLWYNAPVPILGMYYQQLLFWGYVLVVVFGGGRYSLDALVTPPARLVAAELR